jgi:YidC/Oxa1 family membrane protein insertase
MDKRAILGFLLIMIILLLWQPLMKLIYGPAIPPEQPADTTSVVEQAAEPAETVFVEPPPQTQSMGAIDSVQMEATLSEPEKEITIETRTLKIVLSSKGGTVKRVSLKDHVRYDEAEVSYIGDYDGPEWALHNALTVGYRDEIPTVNDVNFTVIGGHLYLDEDNQSGSVTFEYYAPDGASISKTYTFYSDDYLFDLDLTIGKARGLGLEQGLTVGWFTPMEPTEHNFDNDKGKLGGFYSSGEQFDYYNDIDDGKMFKTVSGPVDWVASRSKYFAAVIMAENDPGNEAIFVGSETVRPSPKKDNYEWEQYGVGMTYKPAENYSLGFSIYTGPLEYNKLKGMGNNLSSLVDLGWKVFRPFAVAIYWVFTQLYKVISNYGFVIVLFSILMKLVFWPLSIKSAKSMHKMREVQPLLSELKAKHKNDPAKLQQETMKIYKEYGVNPFGSCLPMLVQLPIFWALFSVLSNSIELRGAEFIFWITDLSRPDPTGQYMFGIGVLPIIMGLSMFLQMKLTTTDPKQKMMVYLMPAFMTFLFSRWASGLVLYWTMFNIMGIFEQWFVKRKMQAEGPIVK